MKDLEKPEEERRNDARTSAVATAVSTGVAIVFCKLMDHKKRRV